VNKRARHTGSIEKRGNAWRIRYWLESDVNGKRKQATETVRGNKREAETVLRQRISTAENGGYVPKVNETVADFLERWLQTYAKTNTALRTQQGYRYYAKKYICPVIGQVELQKLSTAHVQGLYTQMQEVGLGPKTIDNCHRCLRAALNKAVKWGNLVHNPAVNADAPRPVKRELLTWDVGTFQKFFHAAENSPYKKFYHLAALTGMRRSELCGLKWDVINVESGELRVVRTLQRIVGMRLVEGQPKTERSRRTIALSGGAIGLLKDIRADQSEKRLILGPIWKGTGHVFTCEDGSPISGERVSREFARIVRENKLPYLTLHGLRHTAASMMIAGGIHARTIADVLGHSSIVTTMDVYGHLMVGVQRSAMELLDEKMAGTLPFLA